MNKTRLKKREQKNECWPVFSRFIRLRDCLRTTATLTHGKCCSCGKLLPINKLQAGHFMPGRSDAVLLDEVQVNSQCYYCNCERQGNWPGYYLFMVGRYGQEAVNAMVEEFARGSDKRYTPEQLHELAGYYRDKCERLLARGQR